LEQFYSTLTMEELLHYVWKHKIFPLKTLRTTDGQTLEIIDAGLPNYNAGPDFFNAKIKIGGTLWVGNVEIHLRASDWFVHGHDHDASYDSVILHVVNTNDCLVNRTDGQEIPQFRLECPETVKLNYDLLLKKEKDIPCAALLSQLPQIMVHSWFSSLREERLYEKARLAKERVLKHNYNWELAFFITLARNFGFGLNGDAFEQWAEQIHPNAICKHRDDLFQIEAIFFGQAGLLSKVFDDEYYQRLQKEYSYQKHLFELKEIPISRWKLLRTRPYNFPYIRIAQLADLYHRQESLFSKVMEAEKIEDICDILRCTTSDYWKNHYIFGKESTIKEKNTSDKTLHLIILNTVIPFLCAYGNYKDNAEMIERAEDLLDKLKPEQNYITRMWQNAGVKPESAADSQALIQLKQAYCDRKKCLYCRFGYEFLSKHPE
jgi:hypothetical protein